MREPLPYLVLAIPAALAAIVGFRLCVSGRGLKRALLGATLVLVCPFYCCGTFLFGRDICQICKLYLYANSFEQLQHPPGTSLVASRRGFPHFAANYCAYFVGELREYSGERQEVTDFYTAQEREGLFSEHLYLLFVENGEFTEGVPAWRSSGGVDDTDWANSSAVGAAEVEISYYWDLSPHDLEGDRYIVYFAYIGSYFDYRCH